MPRKINLDKNSITNIIGDCKEITVYGFKQCRYYSVMEAFENLGIKVNEWGHTNFPIIEYDAIDFDVNNLKVDWQKSTVSRSREYKSIITSLIIENYKRFKENLPLIPLVFCIGIEEPNRSIQLDVKKVAQSHRGRDINYPEDPNNSSITEKELRRCYKMYAEADPEIKQLIIDTFKFVKLTQDNKDPNTYSFQLLKPFWVEGFWHQLWQERKNHHLDVQFPKLHNWRTQFSAQISQVKSNLFKPSQVNIQENDTKEEKLNYKK